MPVYRLRFFFSPDGEPCLWAGNDAARAAYGYAIEADRLPLSENTRRRLAYLCAWYATSIDWDYPPDPSPWNDDERERFTAAVASFVPRLRNELGAEYEVIDVSGPIINSDRRQGGFR